MKLRFLFAVGVIVSAQLSMAQVSEKFNGTSLSAKWIGDVEKFVVADGLNLSDPGNTSTAYISAYSTALDDCVWETHVKMGFKPSDSNYTRLYLTSNNVALDDALDGYYLQIGNSKKQITLCRMKGKTSKKIAEGVVGRLDKTEVDAAVRVVRDSNAEWKVYSKIDGEKDYSLECSVVDSTFLSSSFSGVFCKYTKNNATKITIEEVSIKGKGKADKTPAHIESLGVTDTLLSLQFSEWVDADNVMTNVEPQLDLSYEWNKSQTLLKIYLQEQLEKGTKYQLKIGDVRDYVGNLSNDTAVLFGKAEEVEVGDLLFTEVLFVPYSDGSEFAEVYNKSSKVIDLSKLRISTIKSSDSSLYSSKKISTETLLIYPGEIKVFTNSKQGIKNFYRSVDESFVELKTFPSLRNETGAVVLFREKDSMIVDQFYYEAAMHDESVPDKGKGVSLTRVSLGEDKWVSSAGINGYATPGYWDGGVKMEEPGSTRVILSASEVCYPYMDEAKHFHLKYQFDHPNYRLTARIYSMEGRIVRHLCEYVTMDVQGEIVWDGTDDGGSLVNVAPYVLRVETVDERSGWRGQKTFVVMLSR